MPRPISTVWEHFLVLCETDDKKHVTCSYCSLQYKHAMANKLKQHLIKCNKCPNDVKNLYKQNNVPKILHTSPEVTVYPPMSTSTTITPSSSTIAHPPYLASVQQKRELRPEPKAPEANQIKSEFAIDNLSYDNADSENPVEDPLSEPEVYTSDKAEFQDIDHSDTSSQLSAQSERCKRKRVDYVRREAILRIKHLEAKKTLDIQILKAKAERYRERRRLATPSPTPSPPRRQPAPTPPAGNWFKSLDRLTRKKGKNGKVEKESIITTEDESTRKSYPKSTKPLSSPAKNLRFFGDTDPDSDSNVKTVTKPKIHKNHGTLRKTISSSSTGLDEVDHSELSSKSYSLSNLHRVEKSESPHTKQYKRNLQNISEIQSNSETESQFDRKVNSKPPISPYERSRSHSSSKTLQGSKADQRRRNEERGSSSELRGSKQELSRDTMKLRRRTPLTNSGESSTEGDSSHQSQRSVVYLHATTVGDIPDPGRITRNRSRDDVSSVNSSNLQVRSTTKSFSIFAPWTPKHYNEQHDVHYAQRPRKPKPKETVKKAASTKTLVEDRHPTLQKNKSYSQTTLTRRPQNNRLTSSSTTLYKKPEKRIKESTNSTLRKSVVRDGKKSQSSEVINRDSDRERVSRSISMPKDNNKKAGWLKFSSKSKKPEVNTRVR